MTMKWISVKDRLPELFEDVLVCYDSGKINIECILSSRMFFYEELYGKPTYWMPLPEPPEEYRLEKCGADTAPEE